MTRVQSLLSILLSAVVAGCGSDTTAPVTGLVTLDGNPVFPARVTFTPRAANGSTEAGVMSSAVTEPDGSYSIEGAQIGENVVGVMLLPTDEDSEEAEDNERPPAAGKPEKEMYTVASGANEIDIKLAPLAVPGKKRGGRRRDDDDD